MSEPQTQATPQAKESSSAQMIGAMGGIGFFAGILIVLTFQFTLPIINKNKAAYLEKALFTQVVIGAEKKAAYNIEGDQLVKVEGEAASKAMLFACYDGQDHLLGIAVAASGQGFQEAIRLVYGYSPEKEAIVGLTVLESKETPGLGDKIEKDPLFRANFEALDVKLNADQSAPMNPIIFVKHGEKSNAWEIDGITGATISSKAVAKILNESTSRVIPLITKNLDQLQSPN